MKGSWFIFAGYEAHEDDCRWRAPAWHANEGCQEPLELPPWLSLLQGRRTLTDLTIYSTRVVLDDPLRIAARMKISGRWITEVTESPRAEPLPATSISAAPSSRRHSSTATPTSPWRPSAGSERARISRATWSRICSFASSPRWIRRTSALSRGWARTNRCCRAWAWCGITTTAGRPWPKPWSTRAYPVWWPPRCRISRGRALPTGRPSAATRSIAESARFANAGVVAALGPHATDTVSAALWQRVRDLAVSHALPVHVHLAQSHEEYQRSLGIDGSTPLEQLARQGLLEDLPKLLLVHDLFVTEADLGRLDPRRHVLGCCPFSQLRFAFPADPLAWINAGIPFVVGTDCAPSNDSMDLQKELRLLAGMHGYATTFSPEHAEFRASGAAGHLAAHRARRFQDSAPLREVPRLESVWSVPGALHSALPCGRLRAGHLAHLVHVDLNHPAFWPATNPLSALALGDTTGAIHSMMLSGRFVGEPGRFPASVRESAEYREALREADQRLKTLLGRLGIPMP